VSRERRFGFSERCPSRHAADGSLEEAGAEPRARALGSRLDIMKIDVEGGEREAFRGARETLRSVRPIIICEVLDWVTHPWGYPACEIIGCLCEENYVWFDFHDDGGISPHQRVSEYPEIRNDLAVPREKLPLVSRWRRE
jgi:hypothetical protein